MCAGSLALGCQILGIFATRSQVYGVHGCHLACLVPLLWRPGGPWDDPGTILGRSWDIGGHEEGPCEVQAWISIDFWWILLPMVVIWLLGASTLASWGVLGRSWDDPGTLEGTRKDLARSRPVFYRFFADLGDPF